MVEKRVSYMKHSIMTAAIAGVLACAAAPARLAAQTVNSGKSGLSRPRAAHGRWPPGPFRGLVAWR